MKIYISGRITGDKDFEKKFRKAAARWDGSVAIDTEDQYDTWEAVNPAELMKQAGVDDWNMCMRACLMAMLQCDAVYMMRDWRFSKGESIECDLARKLEIPIIYEEDE